MADGKITILTDLDDSGLVKGLKKMGGIASKGLKATAGAIAGVSAALSVAGGFAINLASDLEEVQNVVDVTFTKNADVVNKWAKDAGQSFGMAELDAKKYTSTMGAMVKSMGLTEEETLDMSLSLTGLTGDMASFYNLDHEETFNKIRSGISGETEALKTLGINMSVANLEQFALEKGMGKTLDTMTEAEKVQLRYAYLMEVTADAHGDFARTQDSLANQTRLAQLQVQNLASALGESLLPMATEAMTALSDMGQRLNDAFQAGGMDGLVSELGVVLADLVEMVADYLPDIIDAGIKIIEGLVEGLTANMQPIMDAVVKVIITLVDGILRMLPQLAKLGIDVIVQLALGLTKALPELIPVAIDAVLQIVMALLDNIDLILDAGLQLILGLAIGLIDAIPVLIEALPEIIEKLIMGLVEFAPELVLAGIQLLAAIGLGLIQAIPALLMAIPEIISGLVAGFTEEWPKIQENFKNGLTELNNKFNEKWEELKSKTSEKWGELKKNLSADWESIKQTSKSKAEETVGGIAKNWVKNNRQSLEKWTELKDNIGKKANELKENVSNIITTLKENFPGWWENIKTTAMTKWQEIKDGIMEKIQNLPTEMYDKSVEMINKIVSGIADTAKNVYNEITGLVNQIIQKFKDGLGIKSPSTVLFDIGKNMIYGLIDGLKPDSVIEFAQKILSDIIETFKKGKLNFKATIDFIGQGALEFFKSIGIGGSDFGNLVVPVDGGITSHFGYRSSESTSGVGSEDHKGIDIGAGYGQTVGASGAGEVTMAGWYGGYGKSVMIDHGGGLKTLYAHLSEILVSVGQLVSQMEAIGRVGSTGNSTGPHLHFGVMQDGVWVDPRSIWGLATGTNRVPQTGLYKLHKDEAVIPKKYNPALGLSTQVVDRFTDVMISETEKIGNRAGKNIMLNVVRGNFGPSNDGELSKLEMISTLLADILNKDQTMVLDTGALVGNTVKKYDEALDEFYIERRRGVAK